LHPLNGDIDADVLIIVSILPAFRVFSNRQRIKIAAKNAKEREEKEKNPWRAAFW
jgi:hypothetical protein